MNINVGKRFATEDLQGSDPKRPHLEQVSYDARFKEICARLTYSNDAATLEEIQQELAKIKPFLFGEDAQKCAKKINLISKLILNPTFEIKTGDAQLKLNGYMLSCHSKLIKQIILKDGNTLDLSEHDPEVVDTMLMSFKHDRLYAIDKKLSETLMLSEFLLAKKMSQTHKEMLSSYITNCNVTWCLDEIKQISEFYNYTMDGDLKKLIESRFSTVLFTLILQDKFISFQQVKKILKQTLKFPLKLRLQNSSITDLQLSHFKSLPIDGLFLNGCKSLTKNFWNVLQTFKSFQDLKTISLPFAISKTILQELAQLTHLEELGFPASPDLQDEDYQLLPLNLKKLMFNGPHAGPLCFQHLNKMTDLELLFSGKSPSLTEVDIQLLPLTLKSLQLTDNANLSQVSCQHFAKMDALTFLNISNCSSLTDADMQQLQVTLKSLQLTDNANLSQVSCQHFAKMDALTFLNISNCSSLTDADMQQLQVTLTDLRVEGNAHISRLSCQHINKMTALKSLDMSRCASLTDADIPLFPLTLKNLVLSGNASVGQLSCQHISKMTALEYLDVSLCTSLTNADIQLLPLNLKSLNMSGNININGIGCQRFVQMTGLKGLKLTGCTGLTAQDRQYLKTHLKDCSILF